MGEAVVPDGIVAPREERIEGHHIGLRTLEALEETAAGDIAPVPITLRLREETLGIVGPASCRLEPAQQVAKGMEGDVHGEVVTGRSSDPHAMGQGAATRGSPARRWVPASPARSHRGAQAADADAVRAAAGPTAAAMLRGVQRLLASVARIPVAVVVIVAAVEHHAAPRAALDAAVRIQEALVAAGPAVAPAVLQVHAGALAESLAQPTLHHALEEPTLP